MSLFICERHGYRIDSDFIDLCPGCETEVDAGTAETVTQAGAGEVLPSQGLHSRTCSGDHRHDVDGMQAA